MKKINTIKISRLWISLFIIHYSLLLPALAQNISVSPSRFYYKVAPGETKKQILHITNSSTVRQSFNITFGDFAAPGINGKTMMLKAGESEHSCAGYMSASPSFFELDAGKSQDVQ